MVELLRKYAALGLMSAALIFGGCQASMAEDDAASEAESSVRYLEIVTADAEATVAMLAAVHGVEFGAANPSFGNARIAVLLDGGRLGVRAPLGDEGAPLVRPYLLVDDIEKASAAAEAAGGEFAMRATEIPGHGQFAIYFLGGIQYGLWEL